jgi:hypothetical protein
MANVVRMGGAPVGTPRNYSDLGHISQYYKGQVGARRSLPPARRNTARRNPRLGFAIPNGRASKSGGYCAEAIAAEAAGKKSYKGSGCVIGCDVDKQIEKWCVDKGDIAAERCIGAQEALDAGKKTYRSANVHTQIAKWCAATSQVEAAKGGAYTPSSPSEVVEELYWNEDQVMASGDLDVPLEEGEEKKSLLLPIAAAGLAIGVIFIGVMATR